MLFFNALEQIDVEQLEVVASIIDLFVTVALAIVGYVFKSIAIYQMAKKRGFKNLWLAFIPFANWILIGQLIGTAIVWGMKFKNVGVFTALTSFISFVMSLLLNFAYYLTAIQVIFNVTITFTSPFMKEIIAQDNAFFMVLTSVSWIIQLANIFFEVSAIHLIFRMYKPERTVLYTILSIFFDFLFGIFLFTIRKNEKTTFEDYLRKQAEARRAYYNQNTYNYNPYNNNNNMNNGTENTEKKDENPFPEFDDKKDDGNDYFS